MQIYEIMNKARERHGYQSDRALARAMKAVENESAACLWRSGKVIPSDASIIELAELAGENPDRILLEMARSRAKGNRSVVAVYDRILEAVGAAARSIAIIMCVMFGIAVNPTTSTAATGGTVNSRSLYIMNRKRRRTLHAPA